MDNSMIELLKNPSINSISNTQLTIYVENLAHDYNSLALCLDVLNNVRNPEDQYAKFIALQIIEKQMTYFPHIKNASTTPLLDLLLKIGANGICVQPFVVNKIISMIINLFMDLYLINWPDFFPQIHKLLSFDIRGINCYFKIMEYIHDELHFEAREQNNSLKLMQEIKEKMKETYIKEFVDVIYKIIEFYANSQSDTVIFVINVFAKYSHWIENSYIYNLEIFTICFKLLTCEVYQESIVNYLSAVIEKSMIKTLKHQLIIDVIFQLNSNGFLTNSSFLESHGSKLIVKICLSEIDLIESEVKDKMDSELIKSYFHILNQLSSIPFSLLNSDNNDIFTIILPFISRYILFSKKYQKHMTFLLDAQLDILWLRCLRYLEKSQGELEDGSMIDSTRKLAKSVLINLNNHYFVPENCILLDYIYKELLNLNTQTITSLITIFTLLKELPEISSNVILKLNMNTPKLLDIFDIILKNRIIECNDSNIKILVFELLLRYDFLYLDNDPIWPKVLDLLLSPHGIRSPDTTAANQCAVLLTRFIHAHLIKMGQSYYDKVFAYIQPIISATCNSQPITGLSLDNQYYANLFEISSTLLVTGQLGKEKSVEYFNSYILTPLLSRANYLIACVKKLPSFYIQTRYGIEEQLHPDCISLKNTLEYMVASTKAFNGLTHVNSIEIQPSMLQLNDIFINIMLHFNACKELNETSLKGLHRTVTCLGSLAFPSITTMFKHLHTSQNVDVLEFFGFFINMCTKLKISNSSMFEECFFLIFPSLMNSINSQATLPSNEIEFDENIKRKRTAIQFFKILFERDFLHEYVKKDQSIIFVILQFLLYEIHNSPDEIILCEALSCLSLVTIDIKAGKIVFPTADFAFFQTNFISPALYVLETKLKKGSKNILKKVLISIAKIISNLDFDIVVSSIRNLLQSVNGCNSYDNICNMSKSQQEYSFIYRELESIVNKTKATAN